MNGCSLQRGKDSRRQNMKSKFAALALVALIAFPVAAFGHEMSHHHKSATLKGEVVATGCYLGHAARGSKHTECATRCLRGGMPMGLLTSDGTLYLITMNHENAGPYNRLRMMARKTVSVTGTLMTRAGMKAIDVTSFTPAS
jgi:hypothetical protein